MYTAESVTRVGNLEKTGRKFTFLVPVKGFQFSQT
jgi:hypothetical protein